MFWKWRSFYTDFCCTRSGVRDGKFGHQMPGPGQYNPFDPNMSTPKYGFGTAGRGGLGRKSSAPGPGTYEAAPGNDGPRSGARKGSGGSETRPVEMTGRAFLTKFAVKTVNFEFVRHSLFSNRR